MPTLLKLPKPTKQPVEVEWLDAAQRDGSAEGMATMLTCGYYMARDKTIIRLASDLDEGTGRTFHVIPRVHIVRLTVLSRETTAEAK